MSVRSRLTRLERRLGVAGPCPVCRGLGKPGFRVIWDADIPLPPMDEYEKHMARLQPPPPEPQGCPRCGKVDLTVLRICYDDHPQLKGRC